MNPSRSNALPCSSRWEPACRCWSRKTTLSYERLIRLYKEIVGKVALQRPAALPTDWFLTWQENIHSSLFLNIYEYLSKGVDLIRWNC